MSIFGSDKPKETTGEKISVIAELRAKSGHEDAMRSALEALVAPSQKEPGCLKYNVYESKYYTGDFFTYEEWESEAALDQHLAGAKDKLNAAKAMLREDLRITVLKLRA